MRVRIIEVDLDIKDIKEIVEKVLEEKLLEKKEDDDVCEITIQFDENKDDEKCEKKENKDKLDKKDDENNEKQTVEEINEVINSFMVDGKNIDKEKRVEMALEVLFDKLIEEINKQKRNEKVSNENN
jgi:cytochrome oxidase Cu insertion factor (SCO1/SenC/PrrC family)